MNTIKIYAQKVGVAHSKPIDKVRILFFVPPNITYEDFVSPPPNISTIQKSGRLYGSLITDIPLGIISLSSYIKKHIDAEVIAVDFNVVLNKLASFEHSSFEDFFADFISNNQKLLNFNPSYVGISALFTPAYYSILDLSKLSKKFFPNALSLVGGNFPTASYRELLKDSNNIDAICYGEGEKPFIELLTATDKNLYLSNSSSWITKDKLEHSDFSPAHNFIEDLDEIPFLDYDILDIPGYQLNPTSSRYSVKEKHNLRNVDKGFDEPEVTTGTVEKIGKSTYSMPIMTSRGCPFKCTFCASHAAHGRDMRYHSLERVMADCSKMIEKYGIDGVVIQDDHFMAGKDRPYKIVESIGQSLKLGMFFQNALAIYALDLPFLKLLKKSGIDALVLPIESGSKRVLKDLMRKPLKLEIIPKVVQNCRDAGIFTDCNIILGMPGETMQDIEDSRHFLKSIYADWFRVFVATPIPGSEMYDQCEAEELFEVTPLKANYKRAVINTGHLSPDDVQRMTYLMNIELNFVYNSNMRLGNYSIALESFMNVLNVKPDHALAHYYASLCLKEMGQPENAAFHYQQALKFIKENQFWDYFIEMFSIPIHESKLPIDISLAG
ncbi:B12-binding domain-containing radical SAM protein [Chromobacterium amazonense]|uniref:B12-binding domain-containing radical SAM protein n=1 Tax=Chromobacterium amazonense TaxID=1382803 RepID=UPI0031F6905D